MAHASPIIMLVVVSVNMMKLKAKLKERKNENISSPAKRRSCYKQNMFCIGLPVCCFCEDDDEVINL